MLCRDRRRTPERQLTTLLVTTGSEPNELAPGVMRDRRGSNDKHVGTVDRLVPAEVPVFFVHPRLPGCPRSLTVSIEPSSKPGHPDRAGQHFGSCAPSARHALDDHGRRRLDLTPISKRASVPSILGRCSIAIATMSRRCSMIAELSPWLVAGTYLESCTARQSVPAGRSTASLAAARPTGSAWARCRG